MTQSARSKRPGIEGTVGECLGSRREQSTKNKKYKSLNGGSFEERKMKKERLERQEKHERYKRQEKHERQERQ